MRGERKAAIAFAPHSGWAAMVVLCGDAGAPRVVRRERIEIADPKLSGSRQPFHALERLPIKKAEARLARYCETAGARAYRALSALVSEIRESGYTPVVSGILDSSGRQGATLEAILASHALIHTADGEHFRQALAVASTQCGLDVVRIPLKQLLTRATEAFGRPADELQAAVQALGRPVGAPWGADQKSAALLAWTLLAV